MSFRAVHIWRSPYSSGKGGSKVVGKLRSKTVATTAARKIGDIIYEWPLCQKGKNQNKVQKGPKRSKKVQKGPKRSKKDRNNFQVPRLVRTKALNQNSGFKKSGLSVFWGWKILQTFKRPIFSNTWRLLSDITIGRVGWWKQLCCSPLTTTVRSHWKLKKRLLQ